MMTAINPEDPFKAMQLMLLGGFTILGFLWSAWSHHKTRPFIHAAGLVTGFFLVLWGSSYL